MFAWAVRQMIIRPAHRAGSRITGASPPPCTSNHLHHGRADRHRRGAQASGSCVPTLGRRPSACAPPPRSRPGVCPVTSIAVVVVVGLVYRGMAGAVAALPRQPERTRRWNPPTFQRNIDATHAYDVTSSRPAAWVTDRRSGALWPGGRHLRRFVCSTRGVVSPTFQRYSGQAVLHLHTAVDSTARRFPRHRDCRRELDLATAATAATGSMTTACTHGYGVVAAYGNR